MKTTIKLLLLTAAFGMVTATANAALSTAAKAALSAQIADAEDDEQAILDIVRAAVLADPSNAGEIVSIAVKAHPQLAAAIVTAAGNAAPSQIDSIGQAARDANPDAIAEINAAVQGVKEGMQLQQQGEDILAGDLQNLLGTTAGGTTGNNGSDIVTSTVDDEVEEAPVVTPVN